MKPKLLAVLTIARRQLQSLVVRERAVGRGDVALADGDAANAIEGCPPGIDERIREVAKVDGKDSHGEQAATTYRPAAMDTLRADLVLAHRLVTEAAPLAMRHFSQGVDVRAKHDGSPVTAADLEVEALLLTILASARPQDAVLSEETGSKGRSSRRWILDPIDGTAPFCRGERGWATFVALEIDGEIELGVINRPARSQRYWALRGAGAHAATLDAIGALSEHRRLSVSNVSNLATSRSIALPPRPSPALEALRSATSWGPASSDFTVDLPEGRIDVILSQGGAAWDHAPQVVIVEEAGGCFHDPRGGRRIDLEGGVYTNGRLDREVGALLGWF